MTCLTKSPILSQHAQRTIANEDVNHIQTTHILVNYMTLRYCNTTRDNITIANVSLTKSNQRQRKGVNWRKNANH